MSKLTKSDLNTVEATAGPAQTVADQVTRRSDELDPNDPALTGIPRDETHDSIDRHTGTLTDDAVAKRAELASDLPPPD